MITVNRVYVDTEGVVRMSPTGWPDMPATENFTSYQVNGVSAYSYSIATRLYEEALKKAKEESIPFEDQETAQELVLHPIRKQLAIERQVSESYIASYGVDHDQLKPGFYTIEPIQVELQHQYFSIFDDKWYDVSDGNFSHKRKLGANESTLRIVARIVTEGYCQSIFKNSKLFKPREKPVPDISLVTEEEKPAPQNKITIDDLQKIKESMGEPQLPLGLRIIPNNFLPDDVVMVSPKMYEALNRSLPEPPKP